VKCFYLYFTHLIQGGDEASQRALLGLALARDRQTLVALALLAHRLATEQLREAHIATRAHPVLAGAAWGALRADRMLVGGHDAHLVHTGRASLATIRTDLAHRLGANGGRHTRAGVGDIALGATRALHEARLGVVDGRALLGLGDILAIRGHIDHTALGVQELGGGLSDSGASTRHFTGNITKQNNLVQGGDEASQRTLGLAHRLATEQLREAHVAARAHKVLAGAADPALWRVALEHRADMGSALDGQNTHTCRTGGILATGRSGILALLAIKLGTDRARNVGQVLHVLGGDGGAGRVLVELCLGVILDTLGSLHDELALGRLHDDAVLGIHKTRRLGFHSETTAILTCDWAHWYYRLI